MGYAPMSITEANKGLNREINLSFGKPKVKLKDLAIFSRQFATMINSGLSLLRALNILVDQTENKELARILGECRADIETGNSLSSSLAKHRDVFPPLMVNMTRAGEVGGFLDATMLQIAENYEAEVKLKAKIKSAMTYPVVVFVHRDRRRRRHAAVHRPGVHGDVRGPRRRAAAAHQGAGLAVSGDEVRRPSPRRRLHRVHPHLAEGQAPPAGPQRQGPVDAQAADLRAAGPQDRAQPLQPQPRHPAAAPACPILQSLEIVSATTGNVVLERAVDSVRDSVRSGESISGPLADHPVFPPMVVQMMAVGEDTGALDAMLHKISDFYDQEVEATTEALTSLIEPLMIAVLGAIIGGMIVALYMPIFGVFELIQ